MIANERLLLTLIITLVASTAVAGDGTIRKYKKRVPNQYIVVLHDHHRDAVDEIARDLLGQHEGELMDVWRRAVVGFSARITEKEAKKLSKDDRVQWVEENGAGDIAARQTVYPQSFDGEYLWGLDRVDQLAYGAETDSSYTFCDTYVQNATVYVFDTGMLRHHYEFTYLDDRLAIDGSGPGRRVSTNGWSFVADGGSATSPTWASPVNQGLYYHGTAVASLIAGRTVGMDRTAFIWPVRVVGFDASSGNEAVTVNRLVSAIDKVLDEHVPGKTKVANFSMWVEQARHGDLTSFRTAILNLIANNFVVVASANNQNADLCHVQMPAGIPEVITVGGTTNNPMDERIVLPGHNRNTACAEPHPPGCGSNFGGCIDIFAPGFALRQADDGGEWAYETRTDSAATSYAAALVSGAAARYLAQNPTATPQQVGDYLVNRARPEVTGIPAGTTNRLLNVTPECP